MKTIGMARIGKDAVVRYSADGKSIVNIAIAFNYGKKDGAGNQPTQWIDCAMFGERAEKLLPYLLKGTQHCFFLDNVHVEEYEKTGGGTGIKLAGVCTDITLGPKPSGTQAPAPRQPTDAQRATGTPPHRQQAARPAPNFSDMDSDIPF